VIRRQARPTDGNEAEAGSRDDVDGAGDDAHGPYWRE
jgi:hypothetical protein